MARRILGLMWQPALRRSAAANAASTLVGIPLTWAALLLVELVLAGDTAHGLATPQQKFLSVVVQAPWLIPYERDLGWMVPAASLILLVPFFFVSVYVERWIFDRKKELDRALVRSWSWKANLLTYGIMGLLLAAALVWELAEGHYTNSGAL